MTIQAVVFDFDGVIADSEPLHLDAYRALLAPLGIDLDQATYCERYLGYDDEGALRKMAEDFGLRLDGGEIERLIVEKGRVFEGLLGTRDVLYPEAAECVRRLAAAWPVGVASGALRADIDLVLRGTGLQHFFRFIVAAGDTAQTKPAPDPYLRAADLHAVAPSACVAIEDSHWGLESARAAGMRTIAVTHTYPRESLTGHADRVVDSLAEITRDLVAQL
ncbi:MAG TPA: HAD family phosphatase [Vicinamibacterales bacterium]